MSSAKLHNNQSNPHLSQQVIWQYLHEELPAARMHQVERHLLSCKLCSDALEGLAAVPDTHRTDAVIGQLKHQLNSRAAKKEKKIVPLIWKPISIAAAVSVLLAVAFLIFTPDMNAPEEAQQISLQQEKHAAGGEASENSVEAAPAAADTEALAIASTPADKKVIPPPAARQSAAPAKNKEADNADMDKHISLPPDVALDEIEEELSKKEALTVVESIDQPRSKAGEPAAPRTTQVPLHVGHETRGVTQNLITVTGKVVSSEDNAGLPGVNVMVKGTNTGVVTDAEGKYTLTAPQGSTLAFNYIGYTAKELTVQNKEAAEVKMEPDISSLSEVVVIGYGTAETEEKPYEYTRPRPIEGNAAFKTYIRSNLKYPEAALEKRIEGSVRVEFMVETDGRVSNIKVRKGLGSAFDEEAVRLIKEGPAWKPAQVNGQPVRRKVTVSIPFKLR